MTALIHATCVLTGLAGGPAPRAWTSLQAQDPAPVVSASAAAGWIAGDEPLEIRVSPRPQPGVRLAVMIGDVDWTALFAATETGLRRAPSPLRLPAGEHTVVVYSVGPADWQEIGRLQLRVLTPSGNERVDLHPRVDVANKGQLGVGRFPDPGPDPRDRFQDLTFAFGLGGTVVRRGWTTTVASSVVAATFRPDALQFAARQETAPRIDLASYAVTTASNRVTVAVGHVTFGGHRHVMNGYASRGVTATLRLASRADLSLAALNGSAIVGWSNPLGIQQASHRIVAGALGVELTPRPGGARVELSLLQADLLPQADFNEGRITDAERNRGFGIRVAGGDRANRLRFDGGVTRASFVNPADPLLAGTAVVVPVRPTTRTARYVDAAYTIVNTPGAALSAGFRHELVQPLFGSLQGFVRPDLLQNVVDANGSFSGLSVQGSLAWSHDNLDEVPSVLRTLTRTQQVNVAAPFGGMARSRDGRLPTVTYSLQRTHQAGDGVPVDSEFQPTHVPDQVSVNQAVSVEWQHAQWRAGYRFNHSLQDNRQVGRALADFGALTNSVTVGFARPEGDVGLELGFEGAENREVRRTDRTRRLSITGSWRPSPRSTVTGQFSTTRVGNDVDDQRSRNADLGVQFTQVVPVTRRPDGKPSIQVFVRYARVSARLLAGTAGPAGDTRLWTLNTGATFSVF
jgi:hypothetical protein